MISTKGRYALRVMMDLAQHSEDGFISIKTISDRQAVSMKYLETIVAILNKAGMVESLRGKDGGYQLIKAPEDYTVGSIVKLVEGSLAPVSCLECADNTCERAEHCLTLPMWKKLDHIIDDYMESVTLKDLLEQNI